MWKEIHKLDVGRLRYSSSTVPLDLEKWMLINGRRDPRSMSCQLTGNTCYFQSYLFAVLCKAGKPSLTRGGSSVQFEHVDKLEATTIAICRFLLEFFVEMQEEGQVMRPLTNSNFVLDFRRYADAPYFALMTRYLEQLQLRVPDYELQYSGVKAYFEDQRVLHTYR
jgi:hypothetical protein